MVNQYSYLYINDTLLIRKPKEPNVLPRKIHTLAIICIGILLVHVAANQSVVAQTASQIKKMRAAGVPVVLPSYVPKNFRLSKFETKKSEYKALFKGPNNCRFDIVGESYPQRGALSPVRQWTVDTILFGKITLEEWEGSPSPNYLLADTAGLTKSVPGFPDAGYMLNFRCRYNVFSNKEAIKILKSLQVVK